MIDWNQHAIFHLYTFITNREKEEKKMKGISSFKYWLNSLFLKLRRCNPDTSELYKQIIIFKIVFFFLLSYYTTTTKTVTKNQIEKEAGRIIFV